MDTQKPQPKINVPAYLSDQSQVQAPTQQVSQPMRSEETMKALQRYKQASSAYDNYEQNKGVTDAILEHFAEQNDLFGAIVNGFVDTGREKAMRQEQAWRNYARLNSIDQSQLQNANSLLRYKINQFSYNRMQKNAKFTDQEHANILHAQEMANKMKEWQFDKAQVNKWYTDWMKAYATDLNDRQIQLAKRIPAIQEAMHFDTSSRSFLRDRTKGIMFRNSLAALGGFYNDKDNKVYLPWALGKKGIEFNHENFAKINNLIHAHAVDQYRSFVELEKMSDNYLSKGIRNMALSLAVKFDGDITKGKKQAEAYYSTFSGVEQRHHALVMALEDYYKNHSLTPEKMKQVQMLAEAQGYKAITDPESGKIFVQNVGAGGETHGDPVPLDKFYDKLRATDKILQGADEFLFNIGAKGNTEKRQKQVDIYRNQYNIDLSNIAPAMQDKYMKDTKDAYSEALKTYVAKGDLEDAKQMFHNYLDEHGVPKNLQPKVFSGLDVYSKIKELEKQKSNLEKRYTKVKERKQNNYVYEDEKNLIASKLNEIDSQIEQLNKTLKDKNKVLSEPMRKARNEILDSYWKNKKVRTPRTHNVETTGSKISQFIMDSMFGSLPDYRKP